MAEAQALQIRDKEIVGVNRLCAALEKCCGELSERRVTNRLKDVEDSWLMLERLHDDYLTTLNVTALDPNHIDDLKEVYELKERVVTIAEDFLWKAEEDRKKEAETNMERIKEKKYETTMQKLEETFQQCVRDVKTTGEEIVAQIGPGAQIHVDIIKTLHERYSYEFKKLTSSQQSYMNEGVDVDAIRRLTDTYVGEKRQFLQNEVEMLSYIIKQESVKKKLLTTEVTSRSGKISVQKLGAPKFNGSIKEYASFKRNYKMIMENSGYDKIHLAYQLKTESLPEVAKHIVKNLNDYEEIWDRLDEKYGDTSELVAIVLKEISMMKALEDNDDKGMINFADKVEEGYQDLRCIGKEGQLANIITIKAIESRLPRRIWREWLLQSEKYETGEHSDNHLAKLGDLINFLGIERSRARKALRIEMDRRPGGRHREEVNAVNATPVFDPCWMSGCRKDHRTRNCPKFKALSGDEKGVTVLNAGACVFCLGSHLVDNCPMKEYWNPCDRNGCGKYHSRLLHGCSTPGLNMLLQDLHHNKRDDFPGMMDSQGSVILLIQDIKTARGSDAKVFWDSGSTTVLIKHEFAEKEGLEAIPVTYTLTTVGGKINEYDTNLYCMKLIDNNGKCHLIKGYGIDKISSEVKSLNVGGLHHLFPSLKESNIQRKVGSIDILIGMEYAKLQPWKLKIANNLVLYQSLFGTGKVIGGWSHHHVKSDTVNAHIHMIATCKISGVRLRRKGSYPDFFSSEEFGVDIKPKCNSCKACKECSFIGKQLSFVEQEELKIIKSKLKLDPCEKKWTAEYPWKEDPSKLGDNYQQVMKMLNKTETRLSRSKERMKQFKGQIQDFINRKVLRQLTPEEIKEWHGPVHYLSIHEVFKDDEHASTPVRLVVNSALQYNGRSLNSMLMKGPSSLNDLYTILIRFRSYPVGLVGDVKKMYQSINVSPTEQHTRRILWRDGDQMRQPDVYVLTTVTYGDLSAGCIAATALRSTAEMNKHINEEASQKLVEDTYVDDVTTGGSSLEHVNQLKEDMIKIGHEGGFQFKEWTITGDKNRNIDVLGTGEFNKVLGCSWNTEDDTWRFKAKVNYFEKYKGARTGPDLKREEVSHCLPEKMTKRIVLRLVNSVYDPLGLIIPFTIKLKLSMRILYLEGNQNLTWDDPISNELRENWVKLLIEMFDVKDIQFPRCIRPKNSDPNELPNLVTFSDASSVAFCACTYIHWKLLDGSYAARLVSAKARIGPINKISIPRMELQGAVMNCRLHSSVKDSFSFKFKKEYHLIDSGAVMDMISRESTTCKEFVGTRIGEIRTKSDVKDWAWIQSKDNPADLGTHGVNPLQIGENTMWQNGPMWLKLNAECWPVDYHYKESTPKEELLQIHMVNAIVDDKSIKNDANIIDITRFNSFQKLINSTALVLKISREKTFKVGKILPNDVEAAERYWESDAMKMTKRAFKKGNLRSLRAVSRNDGMIVVSGRAGEFLKIGYDRESLVVLMPQHLLSKLYLTMIHNGEGNIEHNGILIDLDKSRERYWIPHAKRILTRIRASCFKCRLMDRRLEKQIMAPLPSTRLKPSPVWNTTSLDLFGPLQIVDAVKRRTSGKCWGLIASCTVTRCVHLDITENYSTDSMLMALRRFVAERGCVSEFQSDQGSQLMASAKEIAGEMTSWSWDTEIFQNWATSKGIVWNFAPVAAPHMNGCSESLIRVTKRMLNEVLSHYKFTFGEMSTIMKEIQQLMNSRPLGLRATDGNTTTSSLLTCNHLLMGRATAKIPQGPFCSDKRLSKRFQFIQSIVDDWWKRWMVQVFPSLIPSYRWHKRYRDVSVGDVVLMKEESLMRGQYKLGRVTAVKEGHDKHVRRAEIEYKNCDGSVNDFPKGYKRTERAIHNLCVIVPVGYKNEDVENDVFYDYKEKNE